MNTCIPRTSHEKKRMPHLFTTRSRKRLGGVWTEYITQCSWCGKKK